MPARLEYRRSQRALLRIPISVSWAPPAGPATLKESTETEIVSAHGALIRLRQALALDTPIEITHHYTQKSAMGRVVWVESPKNSNDTFHLGVELSVPSESFWGVSLPPLNRP
ncbi:MAG: PilZ domain-containing protein [Acidobacteria bacterium]|nr:PilZ domain-containing protein [Acidobacteriota bacterium]